MCLSRTVDLDPDVVLCVMPRKDLCTASNNEDIEYIPSNFIEFDLLEDLPLAQLSATKTMKTIKKEKWYLIYESYGNYCSKCCLRLYVGFVRNVLAPSKATFVDPVLINCTREPSLVF